MATPGFGQLLATKVLHVDPQERYRQQPRDLPERARQAGVEPYLEEEPTVPGRLRTLVPTRHGAVKYIREVFPSAGWVPRYNLRWLLGDLIAGLTVGMVVVPQGMAYPLLAGLTPEYGLYTSFTGAVTYWVFGTSKDIVIGTTAVGSLLVGQAYTSVEQSRPGEYSPVEVSTTLSLLSGMVLLFVGFLRLGWIVDFIPYVSISAFVTAAAITIMSTQFPVALGIDGIDTRESPYKVILNTLKGLDRTNLDAAIGLTSILLLFAIKNACTHLEGSRPNQKRIWATISSLRFTFIMLFYTLISFLVHKDMPRGESKFNIVGTIEPGFKSAGVPKIKGDLVGLIVTELPAVIIILVIEHIAIAKSFGRIFSYTVIPSQEIIAQGVANVCSPFVGGYVCTGSFGASAVLSKAGVRTPLAGVFSAMVLVLALYALTAVFYYIPKAALAGLIIHATSNLLTPPRSLYKYWQLSPFELLIWVTGLVIALFESLEISIYITIGLSLALLLVRLARTKGSFLGRVRIVLAPIEEEGDESETSTLTGNSRRRGNSPSTAREEPEEVDLADLASNANAHGNQTNDNAEIDNGPVIAGHGPRDAYLSVDRDDGTNRNVPLHSPHPGVFVYRFNESFNYTNQAQHIDRITRHILENTSRTSPEDPDLLPSDRLWNDPGPARPVKKNSHAGSSSSSMNDVAGVCQDGPTGVSPILRAIILDFSAVNNIDVTSVNGLVDLRASLDKHAAPAVVEWHFANVRNRWTRRALAVAGFGYPSARTPAALSSWSPTYAVAGSLAGAAEEDDGEVMGRYYGPIRDEETRTGGNGEHDLDAGMDETGQGALASATERRRGGEKKDVSWREEGGSGAAVRRRQPVSGVDRPFFHLDVGGAVVAAVKNAKRKARSRGQSPDVVG